MGQGLGGARRHRTRPVHLPPTPMQSLVLLPGLLCDAAAWAAQVQGLRDAAQCMVGSYGTLDSLAAMARHVLAHAPSERFALAGHSMGARVALEIARAAPHRVQRLALLDTGIDPLPPGAAGEHERARRMELVRLSHEQGMRAMALQWVPPMLHPARLGTPLFDDVVSMVERSSPRVHAAQIRALLARPDARGVLASLQCPVLLLCGRQDAWSPLERHEDMLRAQPGARLVVVEDSGHMSTMEQPRAVTAALRDWLAA